MANTQFNQGFGLYLLSIKEAFESGAFALDDQETLKALFEQVMLYSALLGHERLCTEDTCHRIAAFGKLLEGALPAPIITDRTVLSYQLGSPAAVQSTAALPPGMRKQADALYGVVMANLMSVFHMAVFDLSLRLHSELAITEADAENAQYVIGMSEIMVKNFETATAQCGKLADRNYESIHKFFVDGTKFAAALQNAGAGVSA
ncbi:MAG: hypothetical protein V4713_12295 [Pseudomonadota bacterium]